jgi:hypothetical protein
MKSIKRHNLAIFALLSLSKASIIAVCFVADIVSHACALTLLAPRAMTTVLADSLATALLAVIALTTVLAYS